MNKEKLELLAQFVKIYEGKDEFKQRALDKYQKSFDFLIGIIEKKSSDMPAMSSEYAMRVLGALVVNIEKKVHYGSRGSYTDSKLTTMSYIADALAKSNEQCNVNNFVKIVIDSGFAYYPNYDDGYDNISQYLMSVQLSEEQISKMIRSEGYSSKSISKFVGPVFCSCLEKVNDDDLNLLLSKFLALSSSDEVRLIQEEKMFRRKQKLEVKNE